MSKRPPTVIVTVTSLKLITLITIVSLRLKDFPFAFVAFTVFVIFWRNKKHNAFRSFVFHWKQEVIYRVMRGHSEWSILVYILVGWCFFSLLRFFYVRTCHSPMQTIFLNDFESEKKCGKVEHTRIKLSKLSSKCVGLRVINIEHHWQWCSWRKKFTDLGRYLFSL